MTLWCSSVPVFTTSSMRRKRIESSSDTRKKLTSVSFPSNSGRLAQASQILEELCIVHLGWSLTFSDTLAFASISVGGIHHALLEILLKHTHTSKKITKLPLSYFTFLFLSILVHVLHFFGFTFCKVSDQCCWGLGLLTWGPDAVIGADSGASVPVLRLDKFWKCVG